MMSRSCSIDGRLMRFNAADGALSVLEPGVSDPSAASVMHTHHIASHHHRMVDDFFVALAVCHNLRVERHGGAMQYTGLSPDEEALALAAKQVWCTSVWCGVLWCGVV